MFPNHTLLGASFTIGLGAPFSSTFHTIFGAILPPKRFSGTGSTPTRQLTSLETNTYVIVDMAQQAAEHITLNSVMMVCRL
jgi:hypothetical protein